MAAADVEPRGSAPRFLQKPETMCVSARGNPYSCGSWQTYFRTAAAGAAGAANATAQQQSPSQAARAYSNYQFRTQNVTAFGARP